MDKGKTELVYEEEKREELDKENTIKNAASQTVENVLLKSTATNIHHAILFSCSGWRLNSLPEVKAWIAEAQQYPNVKVEYVSGDPRFVFYDNADKQIGQELAIAEYTKDQIHTLLKDKGFARVQ